MNKVKTAFRAFALVATAIFLLSSQAHAEFRLGGQGTYIKGDAESKGDLTDGSESDSAFGVGIFGQLRSASQGTSYGVHIGYGQENDEYSDSGSVEIDLQDFGIGSAADVGDLGLEISLETGNTLDLLGLIAWNRDGGVTPFLMGGYSSVEVDSEFKVTGSDFTDTDFNETVSLKDDATLSGYKLVAGIEGNAGTNWVWHTALEYADYGDAKLTHTTGDLSVTDKVDLDHWGVRFGIAYKF